MCPAIMPIESSYHVFASHMFLLAIAKGNDRKPRCFRSVRVTMMNIWEMRVLVIFNVTVPMMALKRAGMGGKILVLRAVRGAAVDWTD